MNKQTTKQEIIIELKNPKIPNFSFLFGKEALDISLEILVELLTEEKQKFDKNILLKDSKITFETFDDDSLLDILWSYLNHLKGIYDTTQIRKIIEEFEPKLMDFSNYVSYNKRYYDMLCYCLKNSILNPEQTKIIEDSIRHYKVRGINLDENKQSKLKKINKELSDLSTKFSNNELDSENEFSYCVLGDEHLKDMPKETLEQALKTAEKKKEKGYYFTSNPSEYIAIMKYCSSSKIRQDFYKARHSFASSGKFDNRSIVLDTLKLREQKSILLGYKNYAELSLEFKMAESPKQVEDLLGEISKKAKKKAIQEIIELEKYFKVEDLESWDLGYYFRKYKQENFNIDDKELKKYFEFEEVLKGLHKIVFKLYGLELREVENPNKLEFLKDIRYYEVYKDNSLISYYILDSFYRPEKRAGAWADNIRNKHKSRTPIIINVCNFNPPSVSFKDKKISLLSLLEVETLFHEFGHAIHEMSSKTTYPDLTGFDVEWDFVEVPSQFMEHYTEEKISLDIFAKHYESGELMAEETINSLKKAGKLGSGNFVTRQNELAFLDMTLHSSNVPKNIDELDKKALEIANNNSIKPKTKDYKMYTSFSHIFSGGYSAGYYSYMWAEIIEIDIWAEFKKKGIFDKKIADNFFKKILSAGSHKKANEMFFDFMGREVNAKAFFEEKGI